MERFNATHEQPLEEVRAMTPEEILELKQDTTPALVFETVNRLLAEKLTSYGEATITQDAILEILEANGLTRREIFDKHWLDFEGQYRAAGWGVTYDKPAYNESYQARFEFRIAQPHDMGATAVRTSTYYA